MPKCLFWILFLALNTANLTAAFNPKNTTIPTSSTDTKKTSELKHYARTGEIKLKKGAKIYLTLALSVAEKTNGVSGIQDSDFRDDQGMLFIFPNSAPRSFWMPNTFFDLDIIFLDRDLRVLAIERKVAAHPGFKSPPDIPKTKAIVCQNVLELKSTSALSRKIKVGDKLEYSGPHSLNELYEATKSSVMQ